MHALINKAEPEKVHSYHGKRVTVGERRLVTLSSEAEVWENDDWLVVPAIEVGRDFDPVTQTQAGPVEKVLSDRVERVFTVTDRETAEVAERRRARLDHEASQMDRPGDLLGALMGAMLDEINVLRDSLGMRPRTLERLRRETRSKMDRPER